MQAQLVITPKIQVTTRTTAPSWITNLPMSCRWLRVFYPTKRCPYRYSAKLNSPLPLCQDKGGVENAPPNLDPHVIWLANSHAISSQPLYDVMQRAVAKCPKINLEYKGYQIPSHLAILFWWKFNAFSKGSFRWEIIGSYLISFDGS